jgi:hypothetical protein
MPSIAGRLILALTFLVAALAALAAARSLERAASLHERLLTLDYEAGADAGDEVADAWWRVGPLATGGRTTLGDRAVMAYWQPDYQALLDADGLLDGATAAATTDPDVLFLLANASFRTVPTRDIDRAITVERLDRVIDQYGDVLRLDPARTDAAYNFEYVTRVRDLIARGRPSRTAPAPLPLPEVPSPDLPAGATVHGRPGGPPPEIPGNEFRTLAPMPYDEREESDPGQGPAPRRRG